MSRSSASVRTKEFWLRRTAFFAAVVLLLVAIGQEWLHPVFAVILSDHSADDLQKYLSDNTQGLFIVLLVTLFFDVARARPEEQVLVTLADDVRRANDEIQTTLSAALDDLEQHSTREALELATPPRLVYTALSRIYGRTSQTQALVDALLPGLPLHKDVSVNHFLAAADERGRLWLNTEIKLTLTDASEYVAAYTSETPLGNMMSSLCTALNDVWVYPDPAALHVAVETAQSNHDTLRAVDLPDAGGGTASLPLVPVPAEEYAAYLAPISRELYSTESVVLLRASLPPTSESVRLVLQLRSKIRIGDHFVFWKADRPTLLKGVSFDWSNWRPIPETRFSIRPFFRVGTPNFPVRAEQLRVSLDLDHWVLPGEGVILIWREADAGQPDAAES
jgi:hypothetical protein